MNDKPNFASIMDEAPTEIDRPKPLPAGTYLCVVAGPAEKGKSSKKGTDFSMFVLKPLQAEDDVDEAELEEAGGLEGKSLRATFYETPDAIYRLDEFHEHCGLDISKPMSRRMRNDEVVNAHVRAVVKHRTSEDGSRIYAEIARTLSAD